MQLRSGEYVLIAAFGILLSQLIGKDTAKVTFVVHQHLWPIHTKCAVYSRPIPSDDILSTNSIIPYSNFEKHILENSIISDENYSSCIYVTYDIKLVDANKKI